MNYPTLLEGRRKFRGWTYEELGFKTRRSTYLARFACQSRHPYEKSRGSLEIARTLDINPEWWYYHKRKNNPLDISHKWRSNCNYSFETTDDTRQCYCGYYEKDVRAKYCALECQQYRSME